jgi:hypothetical protein
VRVKRITLGADVRLSEIAGITPGFTGADLVNLVNEAAIVATRRGGTDVTTADFTVAVERIVAGPERKGWLLQPHERRMVAYHEIGPCARRRQPSWHRSCAQGVNHPPLDRRARLHNAAARPASRTIIRSFSSRIVIRIRSSVG